MSTHKETITRFSSLKIMSLNQLQIMKQDCNPINGDKKIQSYDQESNIHSPLEIILLFPDDLRYQIKLTTGDTVQSAKKRVSDDTLISQSSLQFYLDNKLMIDPLSFNDFPQISQKDKVLIDVKIQGIFNKDYWKRDIVDDNSTIVTTLSPITPTLTSTTSTTNNNNNNVNNPVISCSSAPTMSPNLTSFNNTTNINSTNNSNNSSASSSKSNSSISIGNSNSTSFSKLLPLRRHSMNVISLNTPINNCSSNDDNDLINYLLDGDQDQDLLSSDCNSNSSLVDQFKFKNTISNNNSIRKPLSTPTSPTTLLNGSHETFISSSNNISNLIKFKFPLISSNSNSSNSSNKNINTDSPLSLINEENINNQDNVNSNSFEQSQSQQPTSIHQLDMYLTPPTQLLSSNNSSLVSTPNSIVSSTPSSNTPTTNLLSPNSTNSSSSFKKTHLRISSLCADLSLTKSLERSEQQQQTSQSTSPSSSAPSNLIFK